MVKRILKFGERLLSQFKMRHTNELEVYHHRHSGDIPEIKFDNLGGDDSPLHIKTSVMESFADTEHILTEFRAGHTLMLVKIKALREKSMPELKRAVNRLQSHCKTVDAEMAGIDEDWVIMAPQNTRIVKD